MATRYEKQVAGYTKYLRGHKDPEKRAKAARMLGELGAAEAVELLVDRAEKDPSPLVRKNATYALGMFQAFKNALQSEDEAEQDRAIELASAVLETGQVGKQAGGAGKALLPIMLGLVGLLVVLIGVNVGLFMTGDGSLLPSGLSMPAVSIPGGDDETPPDDTVASAGETTLNAAETRLNLLLDNVTTLQSRYTPVLTGGDPANCSASYNILDPLPLSDEARANDSALAAIVDRLNDAQSQIDAAKARIDQACFDGVALTAEEAQQELDVLNNFVDSSDAIRNQLTQVVEESQPPAETPTPAPPTETPEPVDLRPHVAALFNVIDESTGQGGPAPILNQYWTEAQNNAGDTDGCRAIPPRIPADYDLPPGITGESFELTQAQQQVNTGLDILRQGWQQFQAACDTGPEAVLEQATAGLTVSGTAQTAFDSATALLDQVRAESGFIESEG